MERDRDIPGILRQLGALGSIPGSASPSSPDFVSIPALNPSGEHQWQFPSLIPEDERPWVHPWSPTHVGIWKCGIRIWI